MQPRCARYPQAGARSPKLEVDEDTGSSLGAAAVLATAVAVGLAVALNLNSSTTSGGGSSSSRSKLPVDVTELKSKAAVGARRHALRGEGSALAKGYNEHNAVYHAMMARTSICSSVYCCAVQST